MQRVVEAEAGPIDGGRMERRASRYWVARSETVEDLAQSLVHQIVVLRAPAGSGKSVSLAQLASHLRAGERRVILLSQQGTGSVWDDLTRALRSPAPASSHELSDFVRSALADDPEVTLILDGYTFDHSDVDSMLALLDVVPGLGLVVATRERTGFESATVGMSYDIHLLDPAVLRLSVGEVDEILQRNGIAGGVALAGELHGLLGGWPAVTQLAATMARFRSAGGVGPQGSLSAIAKEARREYAALVRSAFVSDGVDHAAALSISPYITADIIAAVVPGADSGVLSRQLEEAGVGRWVDDPRGGRLELVPVLRSGLREQSSTAQPIVEILERAGDPMAAVELAIEYEEWPLAVDTLTAHFDSCRRRYPERLFRAAAAIPEEEAKRSTELVARLALERWDTEFSAVLEGRARRQLDAIAAPSGDTPVREALTALSLKSNLLRRLGRYGQAADCADRLVELVGAFERADIEEDAVAEAARSAGLAYFHTRRVAEARSILRAAVRVDASNAVFAECAGALALLEAVEGRVAAASAVIENLRPSFLNDDASVAITLARAVLALEEGRAENAFDLASKVNAAAPFSEYWPVVHTVRILAALLQGLPGDAMTALHDADAVEAIAPASHFLKSFLLAARSDVLVAMRQSRRALDVARGPLTTSDLTVGAIARSHSLAGQHQSAFAYASQRLGRERFSERGLVDALLTRAVAAVKLGHIGPAMEALSRAAETTAEHGVSLPWRFVPMDDREALRPLMKAADQRWLDAHQVVFEGTLSTPHLSTRELVVLRQARTGASISKIAHDLVVSPNTVKTQLRSIYRKLEVSTREEAVRAAYEWGILAPLQHRASTEP